MSAQMGDVSEQWPGGLSLDRVSLDDEGELIPCRSGISRTQRPLWVNTYALRSPDISLLFTLFFQLLMLQVSVAKTVTPKVT